MAEEIQDSPFTISVGDISKESLDLFPERKTVGELDIAEGGTEDVSLFGNFIIALMNADPDWTCFAISFDKQTWSATPLVGRNCFEACTDAGTDKCFQQGKYSPIAVVNCGNKYRVWLKFKNAKGQVGTTENPWDVDATCDKKGTVLPFCG